MPQVQDLMLELIERGAFEASIVPQSILTRVVAYEENPVVPYAIFSRGHKITEKLRSYSSLVRDSPRAFVGAWKAGVLSDKCLESLNLSYSSTEEEVEETFSTLGLAKTKKEWGPSELLDDVYKS